MLRIEINKVVNKEERMPENPPDTGEMFNCNSDLVECMQLNAFNVLIPI